MIMHDRELLKQQFLLRTAINPITIDKLPADASFRRYERIVTIDTTYILMDAPPEKEPVQNFIKIANLLIKYGYSAPKIFYSDIDNGFLLLEDLGDNKYTKILENNLMDSDLEDKVYKKAIDLLIDLHKQPLPTGVEEYSIDLMISEALLFTKWYIPVFNGEEMDQKLEEEYIDIWKNLLPIANQLPNKSLILRDYHADNLMWLASREGLQKVGLLDFQDAVIGSPVYDIVSLLEDLRRDVNDELADSMIIRYLDANPNITRKDFLAIYSILGAQRNCKIIGFCARKTLRDNDSSYLKMLPRMWKYIAKDLKHPLLLPLKNWFNKVIALPIKLEV